MFDLKSFIPAGLHLYDDRGAIVWGNEDGDGGGYQENQSGTRLSQLSGRFVFC